jgi:hypothetical protein
MLDVQTSEVDAIPAPVSLAQQWVWFGNCCWDALESIVVNQWASRLEPNCKRNFDNLQAIITKHT